MSRRWRSRFSSIVEAGARRLADSFFVRLTLSAVRLRQVAVPFAVLLAVAAALCIVAAALATRTAYLGLRPATEWALWPLLGALLAFVAVLEASSATVLNIVGGTLRLSRDLGRHRIAALLRLIALGAFAGLVWTAWPGDVPTLNLVLSCALALALIGLTLWFERAYRRPAYPRFRDFQGDIAAARQHLARAAHVG